MDLGRGLRRVALLLVPYVGWWAYRGWTSYRDAKAFEIGRQEALRSHDYGAESTYFYAGQAAKEAFRQSLVWGVYVPAGLIVALALLYWVYRGFRAKRTSGPKR
jgi:hypothetical protein